MARPHIAFNLNDVVEMKKAHPCGTNQWKIIRMGADIRIKCLGCGHSVLMPRSEFQKKIKKILEAGTSEEIEE
ncbi:DUF951 domain-containing protein [Sporolactobacillus shoreae]|uniref:DUF951 domain-containing protein n=1 Tax=Sporolactobacillus shoreae TaxID=1465501 RepID=A0A4Z0GQC4_9BACL|nr:DUF951 domain-containing protein [Sporolactobacillus shoreae]TGA98664.1 DUF951 domain-containing protein [Sporolactobacillus shoreae]